MNNLGDRFWSKVSKGDGCWEWQAGTSDGYGWYATDAKVNRRAHRLSWLEHNGPIEDDKLCVCHKCDNRICVNPDHLFLGTREDNIMDMIAKGRSRHPGAPAKHSDGLVFAARALYAMGMTQMEVSRSIGCQQGVVSRWLRGDGRNSLRVRRVVPLL
jgi:hypothetical protein